MIASPVGRTSTPKSAPDRASGHGSTDSTFTAELAAVLDADKAESAPSKAPNAPHPPAGRPAPHPPAGRPVPHPPASQPPAGRPIAPDRAKRSSGADAGQPTDESRPDTTTTADPSGQVTGSAPTGQDAKTGTATGAAVLVATDAAILATAQAVAADSAGGATLATPAPGAQPAATHDDAVRPASLNAASLAAAPTAADATRRPGGGAPVASAPGGFGVPGTSVAPTASAPAPVSPARAVPSAAVSAMDANTTSGPPGPVPPGPAQVRIQLAGGSGAQPPGVGGQSSSSDGQPPGVGQPIEAVPLVLGGAADTPTSNDAVPTANPVPTTGALPTSTTNAATGAAAGAATNASSTTSAAAGAVTGVANPAVVSPANSAAGRPNASTSAPDGMAIAGLPNPGEGTDPVATGGPATAGRRGALVGDREPGSEEPDAGVPPIGLATGGTAALRGTESVVPATPVPAGTPSPASQVAMHLIPLRKDADGVHRMTIHLNPEGLGPISVIAQVRQGEISVQLAGVTEAGRAALATALPELRKDLLDSGFGTCALDLQQDASTPGQQGGQAPTGQPGGNLPGRRTDGGWQQANGVQPAAGPTSRPTPGRSTENQALDLHM